MKTTTHTLLLLASLCLASCGGEVNGTGDGGDLGDFGDARDARPDRGDAAQDDAATGDTTGEEEAVIPPTCGDGELDADEGEECDDGRNGDPLDGCRDDCTFTCHAESAAADCDDGGSCTVETCDTLHRCVNAAQPAGTVCRGAAGACDVEERCTGTGADCPADSIAAPGVVCRAGAGSCDVQESCDGSALHCPADAVASTGALCRDAGGVCDVEERCTGSAPLCPDDLFVASAVTCRAQAAQCDAVERCTGSAAACPDEGFLPDWTVCDDRDPCTLTDLCDGSGGCAGRPAEGMYGVAAIAAGNFHTCAVTSAGGAACWGANGEGQLGDGTTTERRSPVAVVTLWTGTASISAGNAHTCAVTTAGAAVCWGAGDSGQLGNASTAGSSAPVAVAGLGSGVASLSAGYTHTCAVTAAGAARCWGANTQGQLGDSSTTGRLTPVTVAGLSAGVAAISAGTSHTCALTTGGAVRCWGAGAQGQLGNGGTARRLTPTAVTGLTTGVKAIAAGSSHTCALMSAGGVRCWGANVFGEVGDGTKETALAPVNVTGLGAGVAAISTNDMCFHTCARMSTGALKCWGMNVSGQLGNGATSDRTTPVSVLGLTTSAAAVSAAGSHTCALMTSGVIECWGANSHGQLGDGTLAGRLAPVNVICPGNPS